MKLHNLSRRAVLRGTAAGLVAGALPQRAFAKDVVVGIVYVGPRDDFGWNQAHAVAAEALKEVPGVTVVEEENVPETDAVSKIHGVDDQARRRQPDLRDLVRLLRPVHGRHGEEISRRRSSATPRRLWTRTRTRRTPAAISAISTRRHYVDGVAAGLSTKSNKLGFVAAKPIGIGAPQHQLVPARRARRSIPNADGAGDLHRRMVAAGARGGGDQRAGRRRLRRHHLPRRQPEGGDRDRREAAASRPAATMPARRRSRRRASSPAPSTSGSTIYKQFADILAKGETLPNFVARRLRQRHACRTPPTAPARRRRRSRPPTPPRPT